MRRRKFITAPARFWRDAWSRLARQSDYLLIRLRAAWPVVMHRLWVSGAAATGLVSVVLLASFLWPGNIDYSYAKSENCLNNPVFLPRLIDISDTGSYEVGFADQRRLFGYPLFAARTCVRIDRPLAAQDEHQLQLTHRLLPVVSKRLKLDPPEPASVKLGRPEDKPVATSGALVMHLSQPDNTFGYRLSANGRDLKCATYESALLCNLDRLHLKQGAAYTFRLERLWRGFSIGVVYERELNTVEPIKVTDSSIRPGQTVQNIPTDLVLSTNKDIQSFDDLKLGLIEGGKTIPVDVQTSSAGRKLTIRFKRPLKRSADFELRLEGLTALDDAYLLKPYVLKFKTSGGPKVASANIGSYGVGTGQAIVLRLDSEPNPGQRLRDFVAVGGSGFDYSVSGSGRELIIYPIGSWPRCADFSVSLKDGLKNRYGVSGGSAWTLNSRTVCQVVSSIGSSLEGRGIYAYRFGGGGQKVIFVGGTHGDEASSVYSLSSLIDWLEANYRSIPGNKTVIVVPNINPDGFAKGSRTNSRDVDLNRNFPANNWKTDVVMPGGKLNKGGGGKTPLSEPESSAIASYVLGQSPKLVLTYHAVGSLVIANESGNSSSLATAYGQHSGYWALNNSEIGGIFTHDTTGAFEDWLHDKYGLPALLIELSSYYGNEFWNHQSAMWAMINS